MIGFASGFPGAAASASLAAGATDLRLKRFFTLSIVDVVVDVRERSRFEGRGLYSFSFDRGSYRRLSFSATLI